MEKIGIVVGITKPNSVKFISRNDIKLGQFVFIESQNQKILGMINNVEIENKYIPEDIYSIEGIERIVKETNNNFKIKGEIQLLGKIIETDNDVKLEFQRTAPLPASYVYKADKEILKKLFGGKEENYIKIGKLLAEEEEIPVYVDVNQIVLRHLAILAITGAGKSNTVSVLLDNIVKLNGTVLVFDFHGEYSHASFTRDGKNVVKNINPVVDPTTLNDRDFAKLIGIKHNATTQLRYFKKALETLIKNLKEEKGEDWRRYIKDTEQFFNRLIEILEDWGETGGPFKGKIKEDSLYEVINKIEDSLSDLGHIMRIGVKNLIENIEPTKINVVNLSEVDEDVADAIASNFLKHALEERKKATRGFSSKLPYPLLVIVEEAHILAGNSVDTDSKYWMMRIAREGRKFGLGLCIVTQRPKGIDKEILSQMNNMIILKLVEPEDQKHVQSASESLSAEIMNYLPSLNPGEAIIIGNMTKIPLLVKIDKAKGKIQGNDLHIVKKWKDTQEKIDTVEGLADV